MNNSQTLDELQKTEIGLKLEYFRRKGRIFDFLFSQQFDRAFLDELYHMTNKIRIIAKTREGSRWLIGLLSTKKAMLYFIQPSTRTFLSFMTACQTLGIQACDVRSLETSSEVKGESFEDTIRTFSSYFDLIIMRHPQQGYAERASFVLNKTHRPIPVINAGSGKDQHPTQALLDIYTLRKSFEHIGDLDGKTIMMVGDLMRGRTVRSLCYLLTQFSGIRIIFSSPKELRMGDDIKQFLQRKNIPVEETDQFDEYIPHADAVYMTRIQDEWDDKSQKGKIDISRYTFRTGHLKALKATAIIMHPLPRRLEIETGVDNDPRAMYWRQMRNGMWTRVGIMSYLFNLDHVILEK